VFELLWALDYNKLLDPLYDNGYALEVKLCVCLAPNCFWGDWGLMLAWCAADVQLADRSELLML
jgi:hypothetical protein